MNQTWQKDETKKAVVELSYGDVQTHLAVSGQHPLVCMYEKALTKALLHSFLTNQQPV